jgi:hypothetical protein
MFGIQAQVGFASPLQDTVYAAKRRNTISAARAPKASNLAFKGF